MIPIAIDIPIIPVPALIARFPANDAANIHIANMPKIVTKDAMFARTLTKSKSTTSSITLINPLIATTMPIIPIAADSLIPFDNFAIRPKPITKPTKIAIVWAGLSILSFDNEVNTRTITPNDNAIANIVTLPFDRSGATLLSTPNAITKLVIKPANTKKLEPNLSPSILAIEVNALTNTKTPTASNAKLAIFLTSPPLILLNNCIAAATANKLTVIPTNALAATNNLPWSTCVSTNKEAAKIPIAIAIALSASPFIFNATAFPTLLNNPVNVSIIPPIASNGAANISAIWVILAKNAINAAPTAIVRICPSGLSPNFSLTNSTIPTTTSLNLLNPF